MHLGHIYFEVGRVCWEVGSHRVPENKKSKMVADAELLYVVECTKLTVELLCALHVQCFWVIKVKVAAHLMRNGPSVAMEKVRTAEMIGSLLHSSLF